MLNSAKILCIETSSDACSIALNCSGTVIEHYELAPCKHSQLMLPMIKKVLDEADLTFSQLDALAFGCGPGSFTGIRLAASATQGLALGLGLPVISISTLNIMAQGMYEEHGYAKVLVGVDAKMGEVYFGNYGLGEGGLMQPLCSDQLVKPEQAFAMNSVQSAVWFGVGSAWEIYKELLLQNNQVVGSLPTFYPRARHMVQIAQQKFIGGDTVSADQALPIYLRERVVSV